MGHHETGRYVALVTDPARPARSYLDTASAEPLHPAAREVLLAALDSGWADVRRLHPRTKP